MRADEDKEPSMTAAVVAATLLLLRDDPDLGHLVDRRTLGAVEQAVRHTMPGASWVLDRLPWSVVKRLAFAVERVISPGFVAHYALRKATIREHLRAAVRDGYRQVVLLGAGFDMLSMSLPDEVDVFEIDLPATQRAKRDAVRDVPMRPMTYVPADLGKARLHDVLDGARGFHHHRDTVFVAEGFLMYLPPGAVESVLADLQHAGRRTRAILSCVTPDAKGRPRMHSQRAVVDLCMSLLGEEFVWGEHTERVRERLERSCLHVDEVVSNEKLRRDLFRSVGRRPPPSSGEIIVVASHGASTRPSVDRAASAERVS